jgi:hypothetical protein
VRLTLAVPEQVVLHSRLVLVHPGAVTVRGGDLDSALTFPASVISRLEASRGKNPALILGGAAAGATLGAVLGPVFITESDVCKLGVGPPEDCRKETSEEVIGAIVGGVLFGLIGNALARERWRGVPLGDLFFNATGPATWRVGWSVGF